MAKGQVFEIIKRESMRDKVYAAMRSAILDGRLKTGQRLAENPLSEQFQVSRAVIREALQQLSHDGLVEHNAYKGSRVVHLTAAELEQLIDARLLLEPEAVRLAKQRLTGPDVRELARVAKQLERSAGNPREFIELDLALHGRIWSISGNEVFHRLLYQVTAPVFAMSVVMRLRLQPELASSSKVEYSEHCGLINQICHGSEQDAVKAIRYHITRSREQMVKRLEQFAALEGERAPEEL